MSDWHSPLLPPNQTRLEAALARAPDIEARVSADTIATLWDATRCPARLLPWLAWSLSVDDWDDAWDDTTKRGVIASSIEIHRRKGTPWAVRRALSLLGLRVQFREWFATGKAPYTFEVRIAATAGIDRQAVARAIDAYKPVSRSHGITAVITAGDPGSPGGGGSGSGGTGGDPDDPAAQDNWPKTQLIYPRASAAMGIVHVRQPARRVPLVMPRAAAGVGVVRIRQAARAAQITQPRAAAALGIIRLGTLPLSSWQTWSIHVPQPEPPAALLMPRACAGMGVVHVRQPACRVPLVMPRAGAGVGVVRIRQTIRGQPGAAFCIVRLGTLPLNSWQTWSRPLGDVDDFRRGLLHGWTTRAPRTWREGNFDSHALVALLRSKFGV